jgi:hypothetical protein
VVDDSDLFAVGSEHVHMFLDVGSLDHAILLM